MILAAVLAAGVQSATAQSIGCHFVTNNVGGIDNAEGDALRPTELAGAPPYAQAHWNNLSSSGSGTFVLTNSIGASYSFKLQWNCGGSSATGTAAALGTPDGKLMNAFLYSWSPGAATSLGKAVNGSSVNNLPLVYISGLKAWYGAEGAEGYAVVLYTTGYSYNETAEGYLESVSGNPLNNTMVEGSSLTPHLFKADTSRFQGTYIPVTSTNSASPTRGGNYMCFAGFTNDAVLIRLQCPSGYGAGLNAFQFVPIFPTRPTANPPTFSPSSIVNAGVPVTITEAASGDPLATNLWYRWYSDNATGGPVTNAILDATNATLSVTPTNRATTYTTQYLVVVSNIFGASTSAPVTLIALPATSGAGTGLVGYYYASNNFTGFVYTQTNESINFNWGAGSPGAGIPADNFSIKWKGKLQPPVGGQYTFYLASSDGSRLKINNQVIIEGMAFQETRTRSAVADLTAGQSYDIQIDYFESTGNASCLFELSGPNIARQVVPSSILTPNTNTTALAYPRTGWTPDAKKLVILSANASITAPSYQVLSNGVTLLSGTTTAKGSRWGYCYYTADISALTNVGSYTITVGPKSGGFDIGWDVYQNIRYNGGFTRVTNMVDSFWSFQRCHSNKCNQAAGFGYFTHTNYGNMALRAYGPKTQAYVPVSGISGDLWGGWHDATSTDKDTMDEALVVRDMAMALERVTNPADRAALISELRWGTDYLLQIQSPDGGWIERVVPEGYAVTNKSAGIAGQCVAGLAVASAVLQGSDPTYARQCLTAAQNGWSWMLANPNAWTHDWDGTPGNVLGAAVELARATGQQPYMNFAQTNIAQGTWSWNGYWIKSGGAFPGQLNTDYVGHIIEVKWALTPVALSRFYDVAPDPATKSNIVTLCQSWVNLMKASMTNNPFSVSENMFEGWFGFAPYLLDTAHCLLHIGTHLNNQDAINLAIKDYEFNTGFNPFGGSVACGFGTDPIVAPFNRPLTNSIGELLPAFRSNGVINMDYLMMWDEWPVGEGGLGSAAVLDVLAMLNQRAVYATLPPPTVSAVILSGGTFDLSFPSSLGQAYRIERTDTLYRSSWTTVSNNVPGTGNSIHIQASNPSAQQFYRVVLLSP